LVSQPLRALRGCQSAVMSYAPLLCRPHGCAQRAKTACQCARARSRASTVIQSGAARRCEWCLPRPPAVTDTRLALRCSFPRVCACSRPPPLGAPLRSKAKPQALPSTGIFSTNAVKVPVLIALCISNQNACHHAVQGIHPPCTA
jgi:hypothetical protein